MERQDASCDEDQGAGSAVGSPDSPEAKKPSEQILKEEIAEGVSALRRPTLGLFISGISAGLDIGFSLLLIATVRGRMQDVLPAPIVGIMEAAMYAAGFIFVTLGRSELFTEHTTLAVLPVLDGKKTVADLARLWGTVYAGNLIGAAAFALIAASVGPMIDLVHPRVFGDIARSIVAHPSGAILCSAVLAGWLMGLLTWLVTAARDTISQLAVVGIVAGAIGFMRLHHCIVGSVEVLSGVFSGQGATAADFFRFLAWTTLGNAIGGTVFVAIVKYSDASRINPQRGPAR